MNGIFEKCSEPFSIRLAKIDDADLLWQWANDSSVRARSFNQLPIAWETHLDWFSHQLNSPDTKFYLLLENNIPVGQIRYNRDESKVNAEISFSVDRNHRGKGLGTKILQLTVKRAACDLNCKTITGIVIQDNEASCKAFLRAGFTTDGLTIIRGKSAYRFLWERPNYLPEC